MTAKPDPERVDAENPEWTDADFAAAKPFEDLPASLKAKLTRGRPRLETPKIAVKLRLDQDVVARFKAGGPGWQTRINDTLRKA